MERAVEALLGDPAGDLAVCIDAPPARDRVRRLLERRFAGFSQVRVASAVDALDAFPASPVHIGLTLAVALGWGPAGGARRVARLAAALGDAAEMSAVLDDGARVSVARAWALNRARRAGGRAADYGETRTLPARLLRAGPGRDIAGRTGPRPPRTRPIGGGARRRRPGVGRGAPRARAAHRVAPHAVAGRGRALAAARGPWLGGRPGGGILIARGGSGPPARRRDRRARPPRAGGVRRLDAHRA